MEHKIIVVGDISGTTKTASALAQGFANQFPGAKVKAYPEMRKDSWAELTQPGTYRDATLLVWSKSRDLGERFNLPGMLAAASRAGCPSVSFHLDRWWDLAREPEIKTDPFFRSDYVVTTDGGNDDRWRHAGVNHIWMPPATTYTDTQWVPEPNDDAAGKVVFIGLWERYFHMNEYRWRGRMIKRLKRLLGPRLVTYPGKDARRISGREMASVIAAASVVIGDSCIVGGTDHYWSDRVPITLGMGGLFIHPRVNGMEQFFEDGKHLITVPHGDIDAMYQAIISADERPNTDEMREAGRQAVIEGHTFDVRARQIVEMVYPPRTPPAPVEPLSLPSSNSEGSNSGAVSDTISTSTSSTSSSDSTSSSGSGGGGLLS